MSTQSIALPMTSTQAPDLRKAKAAAIAAKGDVEIRPDGTYAVQSQSHADVRYHVTADHRCECEDAARGHECKHALACRALTRAIARAELALTNGTLGDLERLARAKHMACTQFGHDTLTILSLACQVVRARVRFACVDLIATDRVPYYEPDDPCTCAAGHTCDYHEMLVTTPPLRKRGLLRQRIPQPDTFAPEGSVRACRAPGAGYSERRSHPDQGRDRTQDTDAHEHSGF